jgi:conserved domain protein
MQTFEGYNSAIVKLHNSESTTRVSCMYFQGCYYLNYGIMKGECTVNYDSLKLQTNDDNLLIYKKLPDKGIHTYKILKEGVLSIRLGFIRRDKSIGVADPLVLSILPSDFITYK